MAATTAGPLQGEYEKEVRLAVVMYGGVSLAIYINGVAQEFLRLVQSTAPGAANVKLTGTAAVYRKLAWLMGGEGRRYSEVHDANSVPSSIRFLIDIISGTSAGGINGVFLGKALANGQDMEDLKDLWVGEGDISLLINDKESKVKGVILPPPEMGHLPVWHPSQVIGPSSFPGSGSWHPMHTLWAQALPKWSIPPERL